MIFEDEEGGGAGGSPVEGGFFAHFHEAASGAWRKRRNNDFRDDFIGLENIFSVESGSREEEEAFEGRGSRGAVGTRDDDVRVEGDQSGAGVGGVNDIAGTSAEDRVVLVVGVFGVGEASVSAFFETVILFVAEVPASGTLAEVSAEGAAVTDLGGADGFGGLGEGGIALSNEGIFGDFGEGGEGADV